MGRWLKKLEHMTENKPTKLTQPNSVGFVSTTSENFNEINTDKSELIKFVERCCVGLRVDAKQVIDKLLSIDDEQDIINGDMPVESLILAITLWVDNGSPKISGKVIKE